MGVRFPSRPPLKEARKSFFLFGAQEYFPAGFANFYEINFLKFTQICAYFACNCSHLLANNQKIHAHHTLKRVTLVTLFVFYSTDYSSNALGSIAMVEFSGSSTARTSPIVRLFQPAMFLTS